MLAETTIELEARNPGLNRMGRWSVELGQDLLGMWVVDVAFGRISSKNLDWERCCTCLAPGSGDPTVLFLPK
jgi:hypothetical protein